MRGLRETFIWAALLSTRTRMLSSLHFLDKRVSFCVWVCMLPFFHLIYYISIRISFLFFSMFSSCVSFFIASLWRSSSGSQKKKNYLQNEANFRFLYEDFMWKFKWLCNGERRDLSWKKLKRKENLSSNDEKWNGRFCRTNNLFLFWQLLVQMGKNFGGVLV